MKKWTVLFCVLLCASLLFGCAVDVKPVPAATDSPAAEATPAPTEEPAAATPEVTPETSEEPDPTAEPEPTATETPAPTPEGGEDLTEKELDKLFDLVMVTAGGLGPKDGFEEKPTPEQAARILCTYINHMTNSRLRASGEIRDDMLYMTQEQVQTLYRDLFANGEFAYAEKPELDLRREGDRYTVPLGTGEGLIPEIREVKANPAGPDGEATYTLECVLSQEFDPNVTYNAQVVVRRSPETFYGFVIVSVSIDG